MATVPNPLPNIEMGLVIAGSDRRGTAFGVFELSQAIGVSPWYWWADVPPARHPNLFVTAGTKRAGPPSVQYRGIFLNDEDLGTATLGRQDFRSAAGRHWAKNLCAHFRVTPAFEGQHGLAGHAQLHEGFQSLSRQQSCGR